MRLVDGFGRVHGPARVIDRPLLSTVHVLHARGGLPWLPGASMLSTPELLRIIRVAVSCGVSSVRLTGGEPLLRPDVVDIVSGIANLGVEVSMTTNGLRLPGLAAPLRDAGLHRVNVSLDTLDRETFKAMTHRDRLVDTLAGIRAAQLAELEPVKINSVLLRGVNDHEAADLLRWAIGEGLHLRFIEQMPLDPQHGWRREEMVTADEIMASLNHAGFSLSAIADPGRRRPVAGTSTAGWRRSGSWHPSPVRSAARATGYG